MSAAGIAVQANMTPNAVAWALARMRKAGRVTLHGSGHYAKWYASMGPSEVRILAYLRQNPASTLKTISEALLLSLEHTRSLLSGLRANGKITSERAGSSGGGWRNVFSVKEATQ